jgi:acyl-CoA thioesterase
MSAEAQARVAVDALYSADTTSRSLGIDLVSVHPGRVAVAMTVRPDMLNGHGNCHGGILFSCADSAFAFACNSRGVAMVGAAASIEYMAPVALGERITALATETTRTERHGVYDVALTTAAGAVVALFRGRCSRHRGAQQSG